MKNYRGDKNFGGNEEEGEEDFLRFVMSECRI